MKKRTIVVLSLALAIGFIYSCATVVKKIQMIDITKEEVKLRDKADVLSEQEDIKERQALQPSPTEALQEAGQPASATAPAAHTGYYVSKGDSLWAIARCNYGKGKMFGCIAEFNGIKAPYLIREKQHLKLPLDCKKAAGEKVKNFIEALLPTPTPVFQYRVMKNRAYGAGEKLVYAVKFFNVTAGFGTLEIKGIETINGRQAYHIVAEARTAPFFESFYRVRDTIESYMDVLGLFSHRYSKKLEEGNHRTSEFINFYPMRKLAIKRSGEEYNIPEYVQDVLSEMYFFRTMEIEGKKEVVIDVCADDGKAYQVVVKVMGKERISTDAGEFDCVVVKPMLKFEGIFQQKGEITIWMTDDENKVPVLVKANIAIGSIDAILQKATVVKPR